MPVHDGSVFTDPQEMIEYLALNVPMPVAVMSRSMESFIAAGISGATHSPYNHFMWLVAPDAVVSQDWMLRKRPLEGYLCGKHMLKFVTGDVWDGKRGDMRYEIDFRLRSPWYLRIYDVLQVIGHRLGIPWLQIPLLRICSDMGDVIRIGDPSYNLTRATPGDINAWTKARQPAYKVLCRFVPGGF